MNDTPLVTCLCLTTAGRKDFLNRAIDCFWNQTYPNRHLLIVADSFSDVNHLLMLGSDVVISVLVPQGPKLNIGQKRNIGCESAKGSDLIAVWDDDDYSTPQRLEKQVAILQGSGKSVTATDDMLFTDGASWWRFQYAPACGAGTSLLFRRDWWKTHQFDEREYGMVGEDSRFITEAVEHQAFTYTHYVERLMYATIHPGNTSKKSPRGPGWTELSGFRWED